MIEELLKLVGWNGAKSKNGMVSYVYFFEGGNYWIVRLDGNWHISLKLRDNSYHETILL